MSAFARLAIIAMTDRKLKSARAPLASPSWSRLFRLLPGSNDNGTMPTAEAEDAQQTFARPLQEGSERT